MKRGGHLNVTAVMILFTVLFGLLATSADCARDLELAGKVQTWPAADGSETHRVGEICKRSACSYQTTCYCCLIMEQICYRTIALCQQGCLASPPPPPAVYDLRSLAAAPVVAGDIGGDDHGATQRIVERR
uniref:Uncharacterized protein n=1 Tax=Arundo donax TaxID=35708 RepID=A0A0A9GIX3_ARUDO